MKTAKVLLILLVPTLFRFVAPLGRAESVPESSSCALEGVVADSSGASVPGASVFLEPSFLEERSRISGYFCFAEIPVGTTGIRIVAAGFESAWISPVTPERFPLEVRLSPAGSNETLTVTATRTSKRLDEVPVRTEVVVPELIRLSASRTLAEAVEFTPGVRVESNCQNCNFSQIRLLGLQGSYTQILFDGQPTLSSLASVYGVEQIPTRMIDRIEIVKGGGSAIYGPGSVAGVINIIPRRPSRSGGYVEARQEWLDGVPGHSAGVAADWVSRQRDTALTIFGQSDKVRPADIGGDGFTDVGRRDFNALGLRFSRNMLDRRGELTLDYNHLEESRRGGDRLDRPEHEATLAESARTRRDAAGAFWHHTPNAAFDYRLGLSFAGTRRDTYYGAGMDPDAYGTSRNPLWAADSQFNHYLDRHIVSWGGQLTSDRVEDSQPAYHRHTDETYRNAGGFLQHDWFFAEGWELIYGVRVDKHSALRSPIFSPRAALLWSATSLLNLRASVARGFLAPQVFDEDLHIAQVGGEGRVIRNSPELRHETSTSWMLGGEWRPKWGRGVGLVEVNLFHTGIQDIFAVVEDDDPSTPDLEFARLNLDSARIRGVECNLGYALSDRWEFQLGVVEQRAHFSEPEPDFGSREFFRTPRRYGTLTIVHRHPRRVDLFLGIRFNGTMRVPHYAGFIESDQLVRTPGYGVIDASVSKTFPLRSEGGMILTLGARNLTNYYQNDLDRGPDRDSGYVWGPRFPRAAYVSLAYGF
jgi:outer membrane receptor for ferrienterochelin and colicins